MRYSLCVDVSPPQPSSNESLQSPSSVENSSAPLEIVPQIYASCELQFSCPDASLAASTSSDDGLDTCNMSLLPLVTQAPICRAPTDPTLQFNHSSVLSVAAE
mmetsp:Transcript_33199/g.55819  ORF Transcript_33199/g.55819 Transcript_33199/m.55819 type:complete len:103 (-) Transcript_33199:51-359(-)